MDFSMKYTGKQEKTCPIHGPYISDTLESTIFGKLDTKCPKCVELWEQRQQVDERTEALETMRIPPIFWDKTIDTFETRDSKLLEASLYAAKRFIDSPSRQKNLILLGASQCGKTHLACSVLMEI
jgi:DNA replication protein DnaC